MASARAFGAALAPFASGVSVNVLADEGQEGVRRAYGDAKLARLATLKRQYDPENVVTSTRTSSRRPEPATAAPITAGAILGPLGSPLGRCRRRHPRTKQG